MPETATDPLLLAAEQADAEAAAAEAEALAAQASATAARARARAAKLRREAGEQQAAGSDTAPESGATGSAAGPAVAGATAEGDTPTVPDPHTDPSADGGSGSDTSKAADSGGETPKTSGSRIDTAEDSGASAGAAEDTEDTGRDSRSDTATKKPASKVAGRFAAAGRRVKSGAVRRPGRRAVARGLVAVIVLVALGVAGLSIWNHQQIAAGQAREDEFLNAAREGVIALTTLDSGRAADDVKRVLDHSTGAFRTDFQTRSEDFTKVVEQSKVATQGEITAAAVESMTEDSAVVLVSAVSKVTNSAGAQQEPRVWRLSVTVTREDSELKMSKVEFVP